MFYSCFCQHFASQIWSVVSGSDCGVKGENKRDRGTNVLLEQQIPNEVVGRGAKQDGAGSSGEARTEGWPLWGRLGEPRGESILSRMEITDLGWSWGWWGGQCRGIGQERGECKVSVG